MTRYVFHFNEGSAEQKDLLGGKGANLAEMTRLGLPVPPGFTITTDACRVYLETGDEPPAFALIGRIRADRPACRARLATIAVPRTVKL